MRLHTRLNLALPRRAPMIVALTAFFLASGLSEAEARRLALVVGNSEYSTVSPLKNASRDARDVAEALKRLGFEVTLLTDVKAGDFWEKVDAFADDAETADSTVFFYSGHAFQMSGVNYLVPVDAQLQSREAIRTETWNLDGIIARLQDRKRQTLIFLDACRNDPLPQSVRGSGTADGLARLQTGAGTFVAFATEPGAVTYDGAGDAPNSPFTTALLKNLEAPGLSVSDMMIKVRNEVEESTLRRQTPWDQSSLREQFYFSAPPAAAKQELSEADYELLAALSPEDRSKFLDLLRASNFSEESLQRADAAIAIAQANFVIAAAQDVTVGVATAAVVTAPEATDAAPDLSGLEIVASEVTVGGTGAPEEPAVVVASAPELAPEVPAAVEQPAPIIVAVAPEAPATAPEAPIVVATASVAEPVAPSVAPDAPVVVASAPAVEPPPTVAAPEAPPLVVATVEPAPTVLPQPEVVATIPETIVSLLPQDQGIAPLGTEIGPPVRVAALTWETRGILELGAVSDNRTRVSGNEVTGESDEGRALLAAIDPRLLDSSEITLDENPKVLAREAQAELRRLGCYQLAVDGSWGNGSRTALTSYFLAKRSVPDSLEPTAALVAQLKLETKVVCEVRVAKVYVPGKTKAILPAVQEKAAGKAGTRNPKTNRVVATTEERKSGIKKTLLNPGGF
jgi:hypothetical protein